MVIAFQIVLLFVIVLSFLVLIAEQKDTNLRTNLTFIGISGMAAFCVSVLYF